MSNQSNDQLYKWIGWEEQEKPIFNRLKGIVASSRCSVVCAWGKDNIQTKNYNLIYNVPNDGDSGEFGVWAIKKEYIEEWEEFSKDRLIIMNIEDMLLSDSEKLRKQDILEDEMLFDDFYKWYEKNRKNVQIVG